MLMEIDGLLQMNTYSTKVRTTYGVVGGLLVHSHLAITTIIELSITSN